MTPAQEKKAINAAKQYCKVAADQLNRARAELEFVPQRTSAKEELRRITNEINAIREVGL
jgi:hypothetical protein